MSIVMTHHSVVSFFKKNFPQKDYSAKLARITGISKSAMYDESTIDIRIYSSTKKSSNNSILQPNYWSICEYSNIIFLMNLLVCELNHNRQTTH